MSEPGVKADLSVDSQKKPINNKNRMKKMAQREKLREKSSRNHSRYQEGTKPFQKSKVQARPGGRAARGRLREDVGELEASPGYRVGACLKNKQTKTSFRTHLSLVCT